jgi:formylglycine-generating enzyme required for sulfatase activity
MNKFFLLLACMLLLFSGVSGVGKSRSATSPHNRGETSGTTPAPMAHIPVATFYMGINRDEIPRFQKIFAITTARLFEDEVPKHKVVLHAFDIDKYLVTNAQFHSFVASDPRWEPGKVRPKFDNGNYLKQWKTPADPMAHPDHPVVNINWYSAVAYCQWAGKRLPTEAEWAYAARGGSDGLFPWGDQPIDGTRANYAGAALGATSVVGSYAPNGYGLYDMAGNVWQFLADEWRPYSADGQRDPVTAQDRFTDGTLFLEVKTRRVIRGGSFAGDPVNLWVEYRDSHPPDGSHDFVGFRCAK